MASTTVKAGQLRHKVYLLAPQLTTYGDGSWSVAYNDAGLGTRRAHIMPLRGHELYQARQVEPNASVRVYMRYLRQIEAGWRITFPVYGGVGPKYPYTTSTYNVLYVEHYEHNWRLTICTCGSEPPS